MTGTTAEQPSLRRIGLFGGTGFVGSYLVDALLASNFHPVVLVRNGSETKLRQLNRCTIVNGDIDDTDAIQRVVKGSDAVIYNIGILREFPKRGITFARLQDEAARRVIDTAAAAGVRRFLLMSANGVKPDGTAYQRSKYNAEAHLQATNLDWTIFRPSVLFGDPRGHMEFATQLYREIVAMPMPAPLFYDGILPFGAGSQQMSPIHVHDLARVFIESLPQRESIGRIIQLGGPQRLSWKQILNIIGKATGKRVLGVPTPAWSVKAVAGLLASTDIMPVTRDQITMLMEGNTCDASEIFSHFGITPIPFDAEHLQYLNKASATGNRQGHPAP